MNKNKRGTGKRGQTWRAGRKGAGLFHRGLRAAVGRSKRGKLSSGGCGGKKLLRRAEKCDKMLFVNYKGMSIIGKFFIICFFGVFLRGRLCIIFCNGLFLVLQKIV